MGMFSPDENGWIEEEKFIQERLKHEKIESEMFDKIQSLVEENKLLNREINDLKNTKEKLPDIQTPYIILYRQIKKEVYKSEQKIKNIKKICEPILNITTTDRLLGAEYDGKYILANKILKIIEENNNEQ